MVMTMGYKSNMTTARQKGKFYMGGNEKPSLIVPKSDIERMAEKQREEKEAKELQEQFVETHLAKQREIMEKAERLELVPTGNRLIIMPYPRNPYTQSMTESGIFIEPNANYFNPDTGEVDEAKELVACGKVIAIGDEVKFAAVGDDVYYDHRFAHPLPFMSMGYKVLPESQAIAVIKEREEPINKE